MFLVMGARGGLLMSARRAVIWSLGAGWITVLRLAVVESFPLESLFIYFRQRDNQMSVIRY